MDQKIGVDVNFDAKLKTLQGVRGGVKLQGYWGFKCYDAQGNLKWTDEGKNIWVAQGLNYLLDRFIDLQALPSSLHVGLITGPGATVVDGDTMASHGFTENTTYSNTVRPTGTFGTASSKSIDNVGNEATFNINGSATLGGAFLCNNNVKGGSTGELYCGKTFTGGDKSVGSGDTLEVTVTITAADDGA